MIPQFPLLKFYLNVGLSSKMEEKPRISVIMPVYNADRFITAAIDSILTQTFQNFELLILDDASTDNSKEIILKYNDKRIKVFYSDTNQGIVANLNKGIEIAQGEYIARMDADDISKPERFLKQIKFLDDNKNIGLCGSWYTPFNESGVLSTVKHSEYNAQILAELLFYCPLGHPTIMGRKQIFIENKYDKNFFPAEDYELWSRLSEKTEFYNIPESLLNYRLHNANVSVIRAEFQRQNTLSIQFQLWKRKFPLITSEEVEILMESLFLKDRPVGYSLKKILTIWNKSMTNEKSKNPILFTLAKNRLQHYLNQNISNLGNFELVNFVFMTHSFELLTLSLTKLIIKTVLKNSFFSIFKVS